jgi:CBS domain-containing protein
MPKHNDKPNRNDKSKRNDKPMPALTAGDIMQTDLITISLDTPVAEVEQVLAEHRISGAPVTDHAGRIVGVVSLRDLVERYTEEPDSRPRRGSEFWSLPTDETDDVVDRDTRTLELAAEARDVAEEIEGMEEMEEEEMLAARIGQRGTVLEANALANDSTDSGVAYGVPTDAQATAGDVMTPQVHAVPIHASLPEIARTMVDQGIHRVLVQQDSHHVGLVSSFDLLRAVAEGGRNAAAKRLDRRSSRSGLGRWPTPRAAPTAA